MEYWLYVLFLGGIFAQFHPPLNHYPYPPNHIDTSLYNVAGCPSHHTYPGHRTVHGNKCYEFLLIRPTDWLHAQRDCRLKGGHLVTVESSQEETFIMQELQKLHYHGKGVWIGLHDRHAEGKYEWDSGKPVVFSHWDHGQPDDNSNLINQDCVLMYVPLRNDFHSYKDGTPGWHDLQCLDFLFNRQDDGWVCEYEIGHVTTKTEVKTTPVVVTTPSTEKVTTHIETTATPPPTTTTTTTTTTTERQTTAPTTTVAAETTTVEKETTVTTTAMPVTMTTEATEPPEETTQSITTLKSQKSTPAEFIIG